MFRNDRAVLTLPELLEVEDVVAMLRDVVELPKSHITKP